MVVVGAAKGSDDNDDEKDNQRLYDNENYLIPIARRLYNGSALVILRAGHTAGKVMLTVTDTAGRKAKVNLNTL